MIITCLPGKKMGKKYGLSQFLFFSAASCDSFSKSFLNHTRSDRSELQKCYSLFTERIQLAFVEESCDRIIGLLKSAADNDSMPKSLAHMN